MENGIKYFDEWAKLKKELHNSENRLVFHEREIWWYAAGENIGIEINGKNEKFVRPVLILRKYGDFGFFGIPLSSNLRENLWSITFEYKHKKQCALLSQARTYSANRLYRKIGRIPKGDFEIILEKFSYLILKK